MKDAINKYDMDGDSNITMDELIRRKNILEQELIESKAYSQRRIAWLASISMCVYALLPTLPFIPVDRLDTLASMSDMLFLSQASIVGMYFGATAYMSKK